MARTSQIRQTAHRTESAGDTTAKPVVLAQTDDPSKRPGLGLDLDTYLKLPSEVGFPSAVLDINTNGWRSNTITLRERAMMMFVSIIIDKPGWERKVFDNEIVAKWRSEMDAMVAAPPEGTAVLSTGFTAQMYEYCIQELHDKAKIHEEFGIVSVLDAAAAVFTSDVIVSDQLKQDLLKAAAPLEDVPEDQKDWHPGSEGKVLDLVHPSLWPLVYGKSRVRHDREILLEDALEAIGSGNIIECNLNDPEPPLWGAPDRLLSTEFQWLPAEVDISAEGKATFTSYINNLHPVHHRALYGVLERLVETSMPMFHAAYTRVKIKTWDRNLNRIVQMDSDRQCTIPDTCDGCEPECYPPLREYYDTEWDSDDPDMPDEDEMMEDSDLWFNETHPVKQPEPEPYEYKGNKDYLMRAPWFVDQHGTSRRLQVIVKLANIHLTPDKPTYQGGSWHIEGQLNERICATALYYYDSDNIEDTRLSFRAKADREGMMMVFRHRQNDSDPFFEVYGGEYDDTVQDHGYVVTREGRLVVFPNVYQHQVAPFKLIDGTKPGHRKIVALFLVDPDTPVISTANVPPQQQHWSTTTGELLSSKLPPEISNIITQQLDCPYPLEEALKIRERLIDERKQLDDQADRVVALGGWNFCEH